MRAHDQSYGKLTVPTNAGAFNEGRTPKLLSFAGYVSRVLSAPCWLLLGSLITCPSKAQPGAVDDSLRTDLKARRIGTVVVGGALIAGSLISLDQAWYSQYERTPFHFFNDGDEWKQMDKLGHGFAAYTVGRWGHGLMRWCAYPEKSSVWIGGTLGLAYLTAVECLDGTSAEWGFSGWDMVANVAGSGLFIGQQLGWRDQRMVLKYSAHLTDYAPLRPSVLGEGTGERVLKDYNGCTFWLSVNLSSFGTRGVPAWLNMSAGYGAEGMLTAEAEPGQYRQYYLSPDIDLTRIRTKNRTVRSVLFVLNCIKVPMPALEYSDPGGLQWHWLYF